MAHFNEKNADISTNITNWKPNLLVLKDNFPYGGQK